MKNNIWWYTQEDEDDDSVGLSINRVPPHNTTVPNMRNFMVKKL